MFPRVIPFTQFGVLFITIAFPPAFYSPSHTDSNPDVCRKCLRKESYEKVDSFLNYYQMVCVRVWVCLSVWT